MAFERYYTELLNFLSGRLGDRDTARDLVQETYARVFATQSVSAATISAGRAEPIRQPRAFLYQTAKNLLTDHHRRSVLRTHEDLQTIELPAPDADEPDSRLESRRLGIALLNAIDALPPRCREAFTLYKFEELPQAEIARRMGISRNMVEKHIIRGMMVCKRCLDGT